MASRNLLVRKPNHHIFPAATGSAPDQPIFEFDEADIWSLNDPPPSDPRIKPLSGAPRRLLSRSKMDPGDGGGGFAASVPVNVPDWSKILQGDAGRRRWEGQDEEEEDGGDDGRIPPHEYLARRRGASFSVHEGIGRTLKGRDLRSVRNAIWQKTGFED